MNDAPVVTTPSLRRRGLRDPERLPRPDLERHRLTYTSAASQHGTVTVDARNWTTPRRTLQRHRLIHLHRLRRHHRSEPSTVTSTSSRSTKCPGTTRRRLTEDTRSAQSRGTDVDAGTTLSYCCRQASHGTESVSTDAPGPTHRRDLTTARIHVTYTISDGKAVSSPSPSPSPSHPSTMSRRHAGLRVRETRNRLPPAPSPEPTSTATRIPTDRHRRHHGTDTVNPNGNRTTRPIRLQRDGNVLYTVSDENGA